MVEQNKTVVLDDSALMLFEGNMRRIFAMKINRSTFRELHHVILTCVNQDKNKAEFLFESLLTGQIKQTLSNEKQRHILEDIIKNFTIPARLAKEIHEKGEFVNVISADVLSFQEEYVILNRFCRIDGEELTFLSDPASTLNIIQHLIGRLYEIKGTPKGKEALAKHKGALTVLRERLKQLVE